MITKSVRLAIGRTFNLGNFESLRVEAQMDVELAKDETEEAAFKYARKKCIAQIDLTKEEKL